MNMPMPTKQGCASGSFWSGHSMLMSHANLVLQSGPLSRDVATPRSSLMWFVHKVEFWQMCTRQCEANGDTVVTRSGTNEVLLCSQWSSSLKKLLTKTPHSKRFFSLVKSQVNLRQQGWGINVGLLRHHTITPLRVLRARIICLHICLCPWASWGWGANCLLLIRKLPKPTQSLILSECLLNEWNRKTNKLKESALHVRVGRGGAGGGRSGWGGWILVTWSQTLKDMSRSK